MAAFKFRAPPWLRQPQAAILQHFLRRVSFTADNLFRRRLTSPPPPPPRAGAPRAFRDVDADGLTLRIPSAMGLFGDLPTAKDAGGNGDGSGKTPGAGADVTRGWSGAGSKLRAPPRKPTPAMPNPQMLKAQAAALRVRQAKLAGAKEAATPDAIASDPVAPGEQPSSGEAAVPPSAAASASAAAWGTLSADVEDEYVPSRPNSYEACAQKREFARASEAAREAREAQRLVLEGQRAALARAREATRGAAPADRSASEVSGEEARAAVETRDAGAGGAGEGPSSAAHPIPPPPPPPPERKLTPAEKMMMKMGWKEGQGLGKSDQGMTTPLMAKKDGRRSGVIVAAPPNERRE